MIKKTAAKTPRATAAQPKPPAAKTAAPRSAAKTAPEAAAPASDGTPSVDKQPQSKHAAAVANAMFLATDDQWAQRSFNSHDLHFLERVLFG